MFYFISTIKDQNCAGFMKLSHILRSSGETRLTSSVPVTPPILYELINVMYYVCVLCPPPGRETASLCQGNQPCLHDTKEVGFLKTSCQDFLSSDLKYQHLSPPSPEIDYIPIRVELREKGSRALLEVRATSRH